MTGDQIKQKIERKQRRHERVRSKIHGTAERPRLSVFRSHEHMYVQLIDDGAGVTLVGVTDAKKKETSKQKKETKTVVAHALGMKIAELAKKKGIEKVVFDAGGNKFHGRTKQVAEGAREAGLKF